MEQMNQEPGKNEEESFRAQVDDINNIDKEFSDLQKLKMMNDGADMQMNQAGAPDSHEMEQEEINNRSIFVGNVDYSTQPEELQSLFSECGIINRVCSKRRNIPGFNRPRMSAFRGRVMKSPLSSRGRFGLRQPSFRPFYRGRGAYKKVVTNPYERT
ncbi:RNA-binding protein, putative [Plasmodium vinckei lentum]|uniref:RNA-binding protein, putative n=1 Tax=Plasmodium vinckei lentum TaxID=138297 RepID=A0A6V7S3E9_PLAVN|nr:RNA-binding protein, putative [Plasmodium vinckei lentum]